MTLKRDDLVRLAMEDEPEYMQDASPEARFVSAVRRVQGKLGHELSADQLLTLKGLYTPGSKLVENKDLPEYLEGKRRREVLLDHARAAVSRDREATYGPPGNSFEKIAKLWTAYKDVDFTPADVALMLGLLKVARLAESPKHYDSWVDLAGYAANGAEVSGAQPEETR